jgi:hypothetical protein
VFRDNLSVLYIQYGQSNFSVKHFISWFSFKLIQRVWFITSIFGPNIFRQLTFKFNYQLIICHSDNCLHIPYNKLSLEYDISREEIPIRPKQTENPAFVPFLYSSFLFIYILQKKYQRKIHFKLNKKPFYQG